MKKLVVSALLATLVMTMGAGSSSATEVTYGRYYADANQDGICDNCDEEDGCNLRICNKKVKYFVDKDENGICDNYSEESCNRNNGQRRKLGKCNGGSFRGRYRR